MRMSRRKFFTAITFLAVVFTLGVSGYLMTRHFTQQTSLTVTNAAGRHHTVTVSTERWNKINERARVDTARDIEEAKKKAQSNETHQ